MSHYIATQSVKATPMSRIEYNEMRGWTLPDNENGFDAGFLVEYIATGHINWLPREIFNDTFVESDVFTFSDALNHIKSGLRVSRAGWNGKGMFIFLVPGSQFIVNREPLISILGTGTQVNYHGHIDMRTADGFIVPWLCSQTDMLASDWSIAPNA